MRKNCGLDWTLGLGEWTVGECFVSGDGGKNDKVEVK